MRIAWLSLLVLVACASAPKRPPSSPKSEGIFPSLTKPKLRSMWVPDQIEGNKYIEGHFIYVIEDSGSWSKD